MEYENLEELNVETYVLYNNEVLPCLLYTVYGRLTEQISSYV